MLRLPMFSAVAVIVLTGLAASAQQPGPELLPPPTPEFVDPSLQPPAASPSFNSAPSLSLSPATGPVELGPQPLAAGSVVEFGPYLAPAPMSIQKGEIHQKAFYPVIAARPRITYRHHHRCRRRCGCGHAPPINTVLPVLNPATHCIVEIPVCLPSCCMGAPLKSGRPGLFKRGIVTYRWPSGFRMKVIFDRNGDAVVHYFGA